ncbi:MAG: TonB-dependent receptor [Tannerellaceae bacterium]|jgi:TonB-linked SusC/RagA family outer membrane protein|nr:TonB-dependent receptor [Tannerellaceae bacterium]
MMTKRILFLVVVLFVSFNILAQQARTVSGTVLDENTGKALIGASVVETRTTNGIITDEDGNFRLRVSGSQLTVSYIGYQSQTLTIPSSGVIRVMLKSNLVLDEVVVVGYGTQRKSDLTGSISSITEKDMKNRAVSNVSELLAGKASGVFAMAPSGQPGVESVIRIRGFGTVNDNNPLYVVDGQFMDNIRSLNPSDIERIEVLKDASATAIYGSRGSNGVILITTKGGVTGETIITLDAYVGIKSSRKALDMMNSEQYYNFIMEAYKNDESFQSSMKDKFTNQYNKGYDTNWWDEVTRNAFNQNYNVSIRKGTDNSRTSLSLGYLDDQGAMITTEFNRLTLRFNQEYDINKYLTVGANVGLAKIRSKDTGAVPNFDHILKADPFTPVINPLVNPSSENYEYNKYAPTEWSFDPNPVSMLELPDRKDEYFNAFGNAFANLKIMEGLNYRVQYSFERNNQAFKNFIPLYSATFSDDNLGNRESKYTTETKLTNNTTQIFNYIVEQRISYNKEINDHRFDVMGAIVYEKNSLETANAYKTKALGNEDIYRVLDAQTIGDQVSGRKETSAMLSYLGRANYTYADKYLATVSFRADGSSRLAKGNRWGYFPSFSLGWRLSNEEFFKAFDVEDWLGNLKIRGGWGQNGNQRIDRDAPFTLIGTNSDSQWYFGNGFSQGYIPAYTGNKDIKWETSQQTNFGLDATLFGNSLDMSIDFYIKKTKDMLLNMPIPSFGAFPTSPFFNAGDLKNTGFEFTFNYRNKIGRDFNYNAGLNLSTYKTEVTGLVSDYLSGSVSRTVVGGPIGRFWGYKQIGIFQNQNEIDNYVDKNGNKIQPNALPGDFKFAKLTEEGILNDDDRTFIGDPNPDLIFGLNLGFDYKNIDFNVAFHGTIGNDIWNPAKGNLSGAGRQNALADAYLKAWRQEGDNAIYPRISNTSDNNNMRGSTFYVEDGSFIRLQNIQLGYTLPRKIVLKTNIFSSCRFYVSAQNLFTITGYDGLDPEIGTGSPLNMGVDNTRYPTSRTMIIGCNIQF